MRNQYEDVIRKLVLEQIDIRKSSEYVTGEKTLWYKNKIKKLKFKDIIQRIHARRKYRKSLQLIPKKKETGDIKSSLLEQTTYLEDSDCDKQIVFYSCITGSYDKPKEPLLIYSNYKFVLFTDMPEDKNSAWEYRSIPKYLEKYNNSQINRYIKFHPAEFFDTDYAIYIDGNVRAMTGVSDLLAAAQNSEYGLAMFDHPDRNCLYQEAKKCQIIGKGNASSIQKQVDSYRAEGMPENFGLKEATVILCDLKNSKCNSLLNEWWEEYMSSLSGRDQIAFPYVVWKNHISFKEIGTLGNNVQYDGHFVINVHS